MDNSLPKTHKITALSAQVRNPDRVNVSVDGKHRFSLDIAQVADLQVKVGREITEVELAELEQESQFGKLYSRALEYCLSRPHSVREVRDYLRRKTYAKKYKNSRGEVKQRPGVPEELTDRVLTKLQQKNYVNDQQFARWWVETRHQAKGISRHKLTAELHTKGVAPQLIDEVLADSPRSDAAELAKIIAKKRRRYPDEQKFIAYLARQGFGYDDIKRALQAPGGEEL